MALSPEEWLAQQQQAAPQAAQGAIAPVEPSAAPAQQQTAPAAPQTAMMSPEEWLAAQEDLVRKRNPNATLQQLDQALIEARNSGDTAYAAQLEKIIADEKSDPSAMIPDMYESAIVGATVPKKPEKSTLEKIKGGAEAALATITGMTGGTVGMLDGILSQIVKEVVSGEFGTPESMQRIEGAGFQRASTFTYAPRGEAGQEYTQNVGEFSQQYLAPLGPMGAEFGAISQAARNTPTVVRAAMQKKPPIAEVPGVTTPAPKIIPGEPPVVAKKITPVIDVVTRQGKKKLAENIKNDPYNADYAPYKITGGVARTDKAAESALKQGWRPGFVQSVKTSDAADKSAYRKMLNIYKIGKKNDRFRAENRPADVVGKTFSDRVNQLFDIKKQAVKELDTAAEALKNKKVNYKPAFKKFEDDLKEIGVKIERDESGKPSFSLAHSDIEGDVASEALLKRVFNRLGETDFQNGYDLHRAKRWIDTQIDFGKKSPNGLANTTENIVKTLRRNINEALRESSPAYKKANIKYSDSLDSLKQIQQAVGSKKNLEGVNVDKTLGQESRKLLSKYGSRVNMMDAINKAENTVKQYGGKVEGDLTGQVIFANELDHMFGDVAPGSMRSMLQSAGEKGIEAATKSKENIAVDLIKGGYNKLRGINEENAIKSMEKLIQE